MAIVLPVAVLAADLPARPVYKALPVVAVSPWTVWLEGGAQSVSGGDTSIAGLTPPFAAAKQNWGWDGAAAVDYRFDPNWHGSAAFRYGANGSRTTTSTQSPVIGIAPTTGVVASPNSATRKETNWVADFMVGREMGIGGGPSQLKVGLRVAQINGKTDGVRVQRQDSVKL